MSLGRAATPVYLRVENEGRVPLRVSRDDFELVAGSASFRALAPEQVAPGRADVRLRELRAEELAPAEVTAGFVYFEPVAGDWGFLHLRAMLVDARSGELAETLDVPFGAGRRERCAPDGREYDEPRTGEDILFHGCLPRL
jgi:hypothetical protein